MQKLIHNPMLLKIDDTNRSDHSYLEPNDSCHYFGDYYGKQGYGHSPMNQLIYNLKKYMSQKGKTGWHYKKDAIQEIADAIYSLPIWERLKQYTLIPMPSSKLKSDPEYDDRLMQILLLLKAKESKLDVREIISIKTGRIAAHDPEVVSRPTPQDHLANFQLDKSLLLPAPKAIAIFDDVITTGAGFKAAKILLSETFPNSKFLIGIFIARNISTE